MKVTVFGIAGIVIERGSCCVCARDPVKLYLIFI